MSELVNDVKVLNMILVSEMGTVNKTHPITSIKLLF